MKPTVGRIVHWVEDYGEVCQAALVIATNDGPATNAPNEPDLAVFGASHDSSFSLVSVDHSGLGPGGPADRRGPASLVARLALARAGAGRVNASMRVAVTQAEQPVKPRRLDRLTLACVVAWVAP